MSKERKQILLQIEQALHHAWLNDYARSETAELILNIVEGKIDINKLKKNEWVS